MLSPRVACEDFYKCVFGDFTHWSKWRSKLCCHHFSPSHRGFHRAQDSTLKTSRERADEERGAARGPWSRSPDAPPAIMSLIILGAKLLVTLMTPSPPRRTKGRAVKSSPERRMNSFGVPRMIGTIRSRSAVASLTPITPGMVASWLIVAGDISQPVRPGTL